jgi:hypothetical protein
MPSLFPFGTEKYSVYAGGCTTNNPVPKEEANPPGAGALANVLVPAGGTVSASMQLPALYLTVWSGKPSTPESKVANAHVIVTDEKCSISGKAVKRTYTTTSNGSLQSPSIPGAEDPGLPWSKYTICADNGVRKHSVPSVSVENLASGAVLNLYLGSGSGSVSQSGKCE